jgi:catechol 2,3-dioxygenase-like lactoylglutathione lyase family enzyme/DNA-binding transcriptional ArsR family regulator
MGHVSTPSRRSRIPDGDEVFKALADPSRRLLLDTLFARDGRTLAQLTSTLPQMTRFGVMKHLRLLEAANLVTTRKVGREKLHYLNPVPIRLLHDRWISKYAEPLVGALADLKVALERETGSIHHVAVHVVDLKRSIEFYRAVFGMTLLQQFRFGPEDIAFLATGASLLELIADGRAARTHSGPVDHLALTVLGLDAWRDRLTELGVWLLDLEPVEVPELQARILFCLGPDRERIELVERR